MSWGIFYKNIQRMLMHVEYKQISRTDSNTIIGTNSVCSTNRKLLQFIQKYFPNVVYFVN